MPATKITLNDLKQSKVWSINPQLHEEGKGKKRRNPRRPTKEVQWVQQQLRNWCENKGFELIPEYKFNPHRKYKFDWFIKELNLGIEYMGLNSQKSGHTTITGYTKDTDKMNLAISNGFKVHYFTVLNYATVIEQVEKMFYSITTPTK